MSLENIYYIGQTIAVVAILCSLGAIYWQQRQSNIIAKSQNASGLAANYTGALNNIMIHGDLAEIFRKVMFDEGELTPVETTRILIYFNQMLIAHRSEWQAANNGLFDPDILEDADANTAWYLTRPLFREEWKRVRAGAIYGGGFSGHIDSLIKAPTKLVPDLINEEPS